jgi:hypothetical protein
MLGSLRDGVDDAHQFKTGGAHHLPGMVYLNSYTSFLVLLSFAKCCVKIKREAAKKIGMMGRVHGTWLHWWEL